MISHNNNKNGTRRRSSSYGNKDEEEETKYQKHFRRRRSQTHRRLVWMASVTSLLAVAGYLLDTLSQYSSNTSISRGSSSTSWPPPEDDGFVSQRSIRGLPPPPPRIRNDFWKNSHKKRPSPRSRDQRERQAVFLAEVEHHLDLLSLDIVENRAGGIRWIPSKLLPPLPGERPGSNPLSATDNNNSKDDDKESIQRKKRRHPSHHEQTVELLHGKDPFRVKRRHVTMAWETEPYDKDRPPRVDYTKHAYQYPPLLSEPPKEGGYPRLQTLGDMMRTWPQNELDHPPSPLVETLLHFNFSNPREREMALKFRNAELPFKLYDVPEVTAAGVQWTDEYLSRQFDGDHNKKWGDLFSTYSSSSSIPKSSGNCQESPNHFFAFYIHPLWEVDTMGVPPTRDSDWTFARWAEHARYADAVGLSKERPHFYWQSGVDRGERFKSKSKWTFVSRDLPSWSSTDETFFVFNPDEQKGIQCRFGERGVTAATHYDAGRNMVAMVTGAKRYVLSPPRECDKLGIVMSRGNPIFRHSLLNFDHLQYLDDDANNANNEMSAEERAWLERARASEAVDTVLKAGEVLYIPSFWFHYIVSLQKSAQCNARSGIDEIGTREFGSKDDVMNCGGGQ